ncbi:uncharacterized protein [Ptychodera flava]|uniref:uncharacterized protein n=1 Tax=Ptychodera flava TaxID=63121 RepID=UPI00396A7BE8
MCSRPVGPSLEHNLHVTDAANAISPIDGANILQQDNADDTVSQSKLGSPSEPESQLESSGTDKGRGISPTVVASTADIGEWLDEMNEQLSKNRCEYDQTIVGDPATLHPLMVTGNFESIVRLYRTANDTMLPFEKACRVPPDYMLQRGQTNDFPCLALMEDSTYQVVSLKEVWNMIPIQSNNDVYSVLSDEQRIAYDTYFLKQNLQRYRHKNKIGNFLDKETLPRIKLLGVDRDSKRFLTATVGLPVLFDTTLAFPPALQNKLHHFQHDSCLTAGVVYGFKLVKDLSKVERVQLGMIDDRAAELPAVSYLHRRRHKSPKSVSCTSN